MAEILGATDGEIIDSLREDLLAALQENARLEAENARLKAPVSYHEYKQYAHKLENGYYYTEARVNALIAARSKPQEGNDAIPPTQV